MIGSAYYSQLDLAKGNRIMKNFAPRVIHV